MKSAEYLDRMKSFSKEIQEKYSGKEKSYINDCFDQMHKKFNEELLTGDYVFDNRFNRVVDEVVAELQAKNSKIPNNLTFYISKDPSLNAANMGDHCFVINMGAFYFLNNEEQLAAVLSHEIGHLLLNHVVKAMQRDYNLNEKDSKQQLKDIRQSEKNRGDKAFKSFKNFLYAESYIRKKEELEADSIGYTLYRKTKYDKQNYLSAMELMAKFDSVKPIGLSIDIYKKIFDLPDQPFKEEWLKREDFSGYDYSKYKERIEKDSLRSHPEMAERIAVLKKIFPRLDSESSDSTKASKEFEETHRIARMEQMLDLDYLEDYGIGIFLSLLYIQDNRDADYYKSWLGKFFQKIYTARKEYKLNRYLERIVPEEQSESYQQFLSFMWNLSLNEIKNIADYYTIQ
jgi:Zn-dependent protease with chaperone function